MDAKSLQTNCVNQLHYFFITYLYHWYCLHLCLRFYGYIMFQIKLTDILCSEKEYISMLDSILLLHCNEKKYTSNSYQINFRYDIQSNQGTLYKKLRGANDLVLRTVNKNTIHLHVKLWPCQNVNLNTN